MPTPAVPVKAFHPATQPRPWEGASGVAGRGWGPCQLVCNGTCPMVECERGANTMPDDQLNPLAAGCRQKHQRRTIQFSLRTLFLITTLVAVGLSLFVMEPLIAAAWLIGGSMLIVVMMLRRLGGKWRWTRSMAVPSDPLELLSAVHRQRHPKRPFQYSLRSLFVVTALIALGLGLFLALRSHGEAVGEILVVFLSICCFLAVPVLLLVAIAHSEAAREILSALLLAFLVICLVVVPLLLLVALAQPILAPPP